MARGHRDDPPGRKGLSTRDRNLLKIAVLVPVAVVVFVQALRWIVVVAGLDGSFLSALGLLFACYVAARSWVGLRGFVPRFLRPAREVRLRREAAFLRSACGGCALVTGCTAGLGRAFALGLARRGCALVLVSRNAAKLAALEAELRAAVEGCDVRSLAFDFDGGGGGGGEGDDDDDFYARRLPDALAAVAGDGGGGGRYVGLVVNNVGVGTEDPLAIDEVGAGDVASMVRVNCLGTARMCQVALPDVAGRGGGAVVNVSSGSAVQPTPYLAVYSATKAFVAQLSTSLDREWRPRNVRVLCAQPYYVSGTGLFKATRASFNAPPPDVVVDGTLATLARDAQSAVEVTRTCLAHAIIAFLFETVAEDPVLAAVTAPLARRLGINGSMVEVMSKARARFLARGGPAARSD